MTRLLKYDKIRKDFKGEIKNIGVDYLWQKMEKM